jgi:hypothetical protein
MMRTLMAGVILLAAGCATSSQMRALDVLKQYDEAWLRKDVAAFEALLSPAYVYFTSTGGTMDRQAIVTMLGSPQYRIEAGSRSEVRTFASGSVIVISTRWQGRGTYEGKPFVDDQRCSVVVASSIVLMEHCTNLKP